MGGIPYRSPVRVVTSSRWPFRIGIAVLGACVIAAVTRFFPGPGNFDKPEKTRAAIRDSEQRIRSLMEENKLLEEKIHRIETQPEAVEELARDELGMVRPGEVVVVLEGK